LINALHAANKTCVTVHQHWLLLTCC